MIERALGVIHVGVGLAEGEMREDPFVRVKRRIFSRQFLQGREERVAEYERFALRHFELYRADRERHHEPG